MTPLFGFLGTIGGWEMVMILIIGVLLFGKRLPEVGRYLGKGIVEFKKGIKGLEDDVEASNPAPRQEAIAAEPPRPPQRIGTTAPKFEDAPKNANVASTPPQI